MKGRVLIIALVVIALMGGYILMGTVNKVSQSKPWPVPEKYAKMSNPVKSSAESLAEGKSIWVKHCQSCHGKTGIGDGTKASQLKTQPEDMTKPAIQNQSDGALFYKTSEGRTDMPNFKKKLPDEEDIWNVVNYVRTFKK
jgi:mono/diheme cytochrome c family protein